MDIFAHVAADDYKAHLKNSAQFMAYFRASTPIDEFQNLAIGSRPARRTVLPGLESLRAIPWVFAWTQNRLLLSAWLGVLAGIKALQQCDEQAVPTLMQAWPFFHSLMNMIAMVLAKGSLPVAAYYDKRLVPLDLRPQGV